jgi:hypothetical protein
VKKPLTPKQADKKPAAQKSAAAGSCQTAGTAAQSYEPGSDEATEALAKQLGKFIRDNKLSMQLQGRADREYVNVEGWQYAGKLLGIVPIVEQLQAHSSELECKYQAKVTLLDTRNGMTVGAGFAICTNLEPGKKWYQEFAIASMAQTRAIGKAFRNVLAWIMKAAGFEATPAEEMEYAGAPVATTTTAPAVATNGAPARVTVAPAQLPAAIHPALQSEAEAASAPVPAAAVATNPQPTQPTMRLSTGGRQGGLQNDPARVIAEAHAAAVAAGTVFITPAQHELIIVLLNNVAISGKDKQKMLLGIKKITAERAAESIVKLCKRITDDKGALPTDLEQRCEVIEKEVREGEARASAMLELRSFVEKNAELLGRPEADRLLTKCENIEATAAELLQEKAAAVEYLAEMPAA